MSQGWIGGVLWGVLAAGGSLVVVSQVAPPPGGVAVEAPDTALKDGTPAKATPSQPKAAATDLVRTAPEPAEVPAPQPPQLAQAPAADTPPVASPVPEVAETAVSEPSEAIVPQALPDALPEVAETLPQVPLPAAKLPDPATGSAKLAPEGPSPEPEVKVAAAEPTTGAKFVPAPSKPAATSTVALSPKVVTAAPAAAVSLLPSGGAPVPPVATVASAKPVLPPAIAALGPPPAPPVRPAANQAATVVVTEAPRRITPVPLTMAGTEAPASVGTSRAGFQPGLIAPAPAADAPPASGALPPPPPLTPEELAIAAPPADAADAALPEVIVLSEADVPVAPKVLKKPKPLTPAPPLTAKGQVPSAEKLPSAATDPATDGTVAPDATSAIPDDAPAIDRFARPFDNAAGRPLFAIVLVDTGDPQLDRAALAAIPFPVTFVLDPSAPESALAASIYRGAGQEVAMLATGIPEGATAADVEVSFGAHAAALPEAVAVLDPETGGFQGDRPLATLVVPVVKGQGRGLLSWDRGLNAADQVARREGLRSGVVFRRLDGEGEPKAQIRRYLDRAAFKAAQDGRVIVAGETRPDTVAALLEWAVEGRASTVALAPLSAALRVE